MAMQPPIALLFGHRYADAKPVPWHSHDGAELVLVTEGLSSCQVGDTMLHGEAGTLWVMPPGVPQYQINDSFTRTIYVGFTHPTFDASTRSISVGVEGFVRRWLEDLIDLYETGLAEPTSFLLGALLAEIRRAETGAHATASVPQSVSDAIVWLEQHATVREVTIDEVAEHVGLSASHLTTLFRRSIGCPPLKYLQRLRLRQAERLLRDPHLSVKQVAAACGYADSNYFVRVFHHHYGRSPGEWRRQG
jgi:AraC-like DNA-binding protein